MSDERLKPAEAGFWAPIDALRAAAPAAQRSA